MSEKLKALPCPLCGRAMEAADETGENYVHTNTPVNDCLFRHQYVPAWAVPSWNTRTPPPPDAGVVEGLAEALREARSVLRVTAMTDECGYDGVDQSPLDKVRAKVDAALAAYDAAKGGKNA